MAASVNKNKNGDHLTSLLNDDKPDDDSTTKCFSNYSVLTEAHQIQRAFRARFLDTTAVKPRPQYTAQLLMQTMKIQADWHKSLMKPDSAAQSGQSTQRAGSTKRRLKCIVIEESHSNIYGNFEKQSKVITARNPWKKDEALLDYEMESEDEWAEQNGEDLDKKDAEEELEDEEMANEEDEEAGFIVSDGHLSVCEYDLDGEDDDKKLKEIEMRRQHLKTKKEESGLSGTTYCITERSTNPESIAKLRDYAVVSFGGILLPLSTKKPEKVYELGQGDPNAILKYRAQLIQACYASLESK